MRTWPPATWRWALRAICGDDAHPAADQTYRGEVRDDVLTRTKAGNATVWGDAGNDTSPTMTRAAGTDLTIG